MISKNPNAIDYQTVNCAHCGEEWTHHSHVEIFARSGEDNEQGVHITYKGMGACLNMDSSMKGNPSSRRQGLFTLLECEQCDGITQLSIVQHKGQTLIKSERLFKGV